LLSLLLSLFVSLFSALFSGFTAAGFSCSGRSFTSCTGAGFGASCAGAGAGFGVSCTGTGAGFTVLTGFAAAAGSAFFSTGWAGFLGICAPFILELSGLLTKIMLFFFLIGAVLGASAALGVWAGFAAAASCAGFGASAALIGVDFGVFIAFRTSAICSSSNTLM
jgi:hypothetical protein